MFSKSKASFIEEDLISSLKDDGFSMSEDRIKRVRKGDDNEMFIIGSTYYTSKGDFPKALHWFRKAASKNNSNAQVQVGYMYRHGQGVSADYKLAMEWYLKAAESGHDMAENNIGWMYHQGLGVDVDYELARKWYIKAFHRGNHLAPCNLGLLYRDGLGVDVNYKQAMKMFQKADTAGDVDGAVNIGWLYHNGYGVPVDYHLAMEWYQKAVRKGNEKAYTRMGLLYKKGLGVSKDLNRAFDYLRKGADAIPSDPECLYELAYFFENEEDFKNRRHAIIWYTKACDQGSKKAKVALRRLKEEEEEKENKEKREREVQQNTSNKSVPELTLNVNESGSLPLPRDTILAQYDEQLMILLSKKFNDLEEKFNIRIRELEKSGAEKDKRIRKLEKIIARSNLTRNNQDQNQYANDKNQNDSNIVNNANTNVDGTIDDPSNDINYDTPVTSDQEDTLN